MSVYWNSIQVVHQVGGGGTKKESEGGGGGRNRCIPTLTQITDFICAAELLDFEEEWAQREPHPLVKLTKVARIQFRSTRQFLAIWLMAFSTQGGRAIISVTP